MAHGSRLPGQSGPPLRLAAIWTPTEQESSVHHLLFLTDPSLAIKVSYGTHQRNQNEKVYREVNSFQLLKASCCPGFPLPDREHGQVYGGCEEPQLMGYFSPVDLPFTLT